MAPEYSSEITVLRVMGDPKDQTTILTKIEPSTAMSGILSSKSVRLTQGKM